MMDIHYLSNSRQYINLLRILQDLYSLGFRVISQEVNMVKGVDNKGFYNLLEVVFMREQKRWRWFTFRIEMTEPEGTKMRKYFFHTVFILTFILFIVIAHFPYEFKLNVTLIKKEDPEIKTILLWTRKFSDRTFGLR